MKERLYRQKPFLKSVLQEANRHKRQQQLQYANADQINALSELVMNTLRGAVPLGKLTVRRLSPFRQALRMIASPRQSVKRRRQLLMQRGGDAILWKELQRCYQCAL